MKKNTDNIDFSSIICLFFQAAFNPTALLE